MTLRVYLKNHFDGCESHVDVEVADNASLDEINKEARNIAEQHHSEKAEWAIFN